jgi:hypothetical protein
MRNTLGTLKVTLNDLNAIRKKLTLIPIQLMLSIDTDLLSNEDLLQQVQQLQFHGYKEEGGLNSGLLCSFIMPKCINE